MKISNVDVLHDGEDSRVIPDQDQHISQSLPKISDQAHTICKQVTVQANIESSYSNALPGILDANNCSATAHIVNRSQSFSSLAHTTVDCPVTSRRSSEVGCDSSPPPPLSSITNDRLGNHPSATSVAQSDAFESDSDTDKLLNKSYQSHLPVYIPELKQTAEQELTKRVRKGSIGHPENNQLRLSGLLFRVSYLGSTRIIISSGGGSDHHSSRQSRLRQAKEAIGRIKDPDDQSQPSVPVEIFISTDRIVIFKDSTQDVLFDHCLRSISFVADIGDLFVLMTSPPHPLTSSACETSAQPSTSTASSSSDKMICHVLECSQAKELARSVGEAFQLDYIDYLRQSGASDTQLLDQFDSGSRAEIFSDELSAFCDQNNQKEVVIKKRSGEPLGVVIVESGWGSLLPTALLANMLPSGPAARSGQLLIGQALLSINGTSLVGLPLLNCQRLIKACSNLTMVKLVVVQSSPVIEVLIRRPSLKYQLGFSVQDGVVCSLLRGGIAERGGIRVDHRIIEINGQSVVAVPHEQIVDMLSNVYGEITQRRRMENGDQLLQ